MIAAPGAAPARLVWSVAALVQAVADAVAARFTACAVRGEVSGFARAASGHCYFTLKDANGSAAVLRCAMFRRAAALLDFAPQDGQLVELRGRLGVYESRSELQLVVESMQRVGAGALFEQFLKLKARLEAEGLFDAARKRVVPPYPRRLAVVTSLGAAALHDVITTLARRSPHVEVVVYPSAVQGADAPAALCAALAGVARRNDADCVILCRGGGSLEDLWAFNDERVVRAVCAMPMPLICGVGHETDVTLADFAADLRAPTPTAAAELAAPDGQACRASLHLIAELLQRRVHELLDGRAQRLDTLTMRLARPAEVMRRRAQRLDLLAHRWLAATRLGVDRRRAHATHLQARLGRATAVQLSVQQRSLASLDARLRALDPQHVLARGYAWLTGPSGQPLAGVAGLEVGSALQARMVDGVAGVTVTDVQPTPPRSR